MTRATGTLLALVVGSVATTACRAIAGYEEVTACATGAFACSGTQPLQCVSSTLVPYGSACDGVTPACLEGRCVACAPHATQCAGSRVQTCDETGAWQDSGTCSGDQPYCLNGACSITAPSCAAGGHGLSDCGPGEPCCLSYVVDGGTFDRTYDRTFSDAGFPVLSPDAGQADAMTDPATVHSFRLDKYLVTVGRFRQFVSAISGGGDMATGATPLWLPSTGSGKHAHLNGGKGLADSASPGSFEPGWQAVDDGNVEPTNEDLWNCTVEQVWTASPEDLEDMPVTCVNWYEAYAFCIWDGGFLPSEAEWEYAAAGGGEQRVYPWGATDPGTSNQYAIFDCNYPGNNDDAGCAKSGNIAPVGSAALGRGRWSQLDLAGDVWEWTLDHYDPYTDCTDCANLSPGGMRVFRGGGFNSGPKALVPSTRDFIEPTNREFYVGFRCARSP